MILLVVRLNMISLYLQLLNSSFNVKAEPIVCKLIDALNSFLKNKINYLVMGNYLIKKIK